LSNLIFNDNYCRKVLPYLKREYFEDNHSGILYELINDFINKYNNLPSKEALYINLSNFKNADDKQFEECKSIIEELQIDENTTHEWLLDETEKFVQNRAIYLALLQSIQICDGKDTKLDKAAIPEILTDAISLTFDAHIGHDYFEDAEERWKFYHQIEYKTPFNIDILNKITKGGVSRKTISIIMAGPGVGKSFVMCHFAANNLIEGKNVLYITLEMSEEMISQRIDENLLDLDVDDLLLLPKDVFLKKVNNIHQKTVGKLVVHEYPTRQAGSANFRALLRDLKIKKNFVPDIIYIDYLNICISSTLRSSKSTLYEYVKVVGEEIRGLAVEFNVPIITATQFNREGYRSSDPGMDDVSESFGTSFTADLIVALVTSDELEKDNQLEFVQIKNRYNPLNYYKKFLVGINRAKMQLHNVGGADQDISLSQEQKEKFINDDLKGKLNRDAFSDFN
jgi:archaellum biogenesis ATPase FlaH